MTRYVSCVQFVYFSFLIQLYLFSQAMTAVIEWPPRLQCFQFHSETHTVIAWDWKEVIKPSRAGAIGHFRIFKHNVFPQRENQIFRLCTSRQLTIETSTPLLRYESAHCCFSLKLSKTMSACFERITSDQKLFNLCEAVWFCYCDIATASCWPISVVVTITRLRCIDYRAQVWYVQNVIKTVPHPIF